MLAMWEKEKHKWKPMSWIAPALLSVGTRVPQICLVCCHWIWSTLQIICMLTKMSKVFGKKQSHCILTISQKKFGNLFPFFHVLIRLGTKNFFAVDETKWSWELLQLAQKYRQHTFFSPWIRLLKVLSCLNYLGIFSKRENVRE
jgi:hypothetical protein